MVRRSFILHKLRVDFNGSHRGWEEPVLACRSRAALGWRYRARPGWASVPENSLTVVTVTVGMAGLEGSRSRKIKQQTSFE